VHLQDFFPISGIWLGFHHKIACLVGMGNPGCGFGNEGIWWEVTSLRGGEEERLRLGAQKRCVSVMEERDGGTAEVGVGVR
jgi:hypothetical protein